MSRSMTSYVLFMTSETLKRRDVPTEPENMKAKKEYQRFYVFARLQLVEGICDNLKCSERLFMFIIIRSTLK